MAKLDMSMLAMSNMDSRTQSERKQRIASSGC